MLPPFAEARPVDWSINTYGPCPPRDASGPLGLDGATGSGHWVIPLGLRGQPGLDGATGRGLYGAPAVAPGQRPPALSPRVRP